MLQPQRDRAVTTQHCRIGCDRAHRRAYRVEDALRVVAVVIGHAVRRFRGDREYGRLIRRVAVFDMVWGERTVLLVLANAVGVLGRIAKGALVEVGRPAPANVEHDEANGAANGGIGPVAGAERIRAAVHADRAGNRAVDDHQRRRQVGRRLHAVEIERWVGESEHGGTYHRGVFGFAAGHDHVDGENLAGQRAPAWRDLALDEGWVAAQRRNDGVDLVLRRRDDGQTVGPAALEIEFHQVHVGDVTRQRL